MKRQSQVHLYLTDEEKRLLREEAERHGMTVNAWLRMTMRQRLGMLTAAEASA